jgi:hypothetical protein
MDGKPMLYVFETCRDFIRTVPALQHDEKRPEDLDTDGEDHIADEARYMCMSRPWTTHGEKSRPIRGVGQATLSEILQQEALENSSSRVKL